MILGSAISAIGWTHLTGYPNLGGKVDHDDRGDDRVLLSSRGALERTESRDEAVEDGGEDHA